MKFVCRGIDKSGSPVVEVVEAGSEADAGEVLRRRGIFATEIKKHDGGEVEGAGSRGRRSGLSASARLKLLSAFARQVSITVSTGTPLVDALQSQENQAQNPKWKKVLAEVRQRVEEGDSLSRAMEMYPDCFDAVCRSLVAAGESGGRLDAMLQRLSSLTRRQLKIRTTVSGAMVYPILLTVIAGGVLAGMIGFVLPRFEGMFKTLDAPLPPSTKFVMDVSAFARGYWWAILGGLAAAVVSLKFYLASAGGKRVFDAVVVALPLAGHVVRSLMVARIARVMGVLLEGKVTLLESLRLARACATNSQYRDLLGKAEEAVTRGENMSSVLASNALFSPSVTEAVKSGERTGQVGAVLLSLSDAMDEDNEVLVRTLTGILEPLILVVLGLVVGTVAIGMFLPLFDMTAAGTPGGPGGAGGGVP